MQNKRHHHVFHIAFIPLLLILIAPQWGKATMAPTLRHYEELTVIAEEEMANLEKRFESAQKAWTLLSDGEEKILYPSVVIQHQKDTDLSVIERFHLATVRNSILEKRLEAFRGKIEESLGTSQAIYIDLSEQQATLIENGEILRNYPVSSGAWETPTPRGRFQIHSKQTLRISSQDVPYRMPYYMAFTKSKSHGFHALPYLGNVATNSDYWHEALDHIGRPVSHGCVRFLPDDAKEMYEWAEVGTQVIIGA